MCVEHDCKFTERANRALREAENQARLVNQQHVSMGHVLLAIAADEESMGSRALRRMGVGYVTLRDFTQNAVGQFNMPPESGALPQTPPLGAVLERAHRRAREGGHAYTGTDHIASEIFADTSGVFPASMFRELGVTADDFEQALADVEGISRGRAPADRRVR